MKHILFLLLSISLLIGCKKEAQKVPTSKIDIPISIGFDLSQPASDAAKLMPPTKGGDVDRLRFRVVYEFKASNQETISRGTILHGISSSNINLKDTLPSGAYHLAILGNYVYVDENGLITDEQYRVDPTQGLQNITLLHPEEEKRWAFAYAGSEEITVTENTSKFSIPIERCVMQIQFTRGDGYDLENTTDRANIKLTNFSTRYNVYTGKATPDPTEKPIFIREVDNRSENYFRVTLFESLQDCYIDLEYLTPDGKSEQFDQYFNNRKFYAENGGEIYKCNFFKNRLILFNTMAKFLKEFFSTTVSFPLMGDETIFKESHFSTVLPADSLALVDFYHAMNGEEWVQPWRLELPVSTWAGIGLSSIAEGIPQRVVAIRLGVDLNSDDLKGENVGNLKGTLPASLGNLSQLTHLNVQGHIEQIEDFLDRLPLLDTLAIANAANKSIWDRPNRAILRLTEFQTELKTGFFQGIFLDNVNQLWVNKKLNSVCFTNLTLLNDPILFDNATTLPDLSILTFYHTNGASGVSDKFYKLQAPITTLSFATSKSHNDSGDQMKNISLNLDQLIDVFPKMEWLQIIADNQQIPAKIERWRSLRLLNLEGDVIGEIPKELFMDQLFCCMLSGKTHLTGTIPAEWARTRQVDITNSPGIKIE